MVYVHVGSGSVGVHCVSWGIPLYHILLAISIHIPWHMQHAGCSASRGGLQPSLLPFSLLSFLLSSRSFLLHQPPRLFPSTIPGNIVVIYVILCSCPWSYSTLFSDHLFPFSYFHNQTCLNGSSLRSFHS
ncbi:hypothetical protein K503DRAFT_154104 [Rhizopogon vinicolor AM-OR11-026]|uniref:Uncharacterized protein n=1 Tax=Rhizopogon vinicolor AM-OR11-026 TaxID=1314800 RepID=A0A1B7NER4_9AGAM|nr:hypothetical protein K503DRAFT_154104 [Rhizopogon vinicolor AM-OR11-026]